MVGVVVNVQCLAPPLTGVGRYTFEILRMLAQSPCVESLHCFSEWSFYRPEQVLRNARDGDPARGGASALPAGTGSRLRGVVRAIPGAYPLRCEIRNMAFRLRAKALSGCVYHEPNYVLRPFSGPRVVTVHDVSHMRHPAFHPASRVRYLEKRLPASLAEADRVITVSGFSKRELVDTLGIAPEKIAVTPLGVDAAFIPRTARETASFLESVGLAHGRYLLAVGTIEPRKNLFRLLRAYADLPPALRDRFPMVLAGAPGWGPPLDKGLVSALEAAGHLRNLGYVPGGDLPLLYAGAGGFVFPSLYEGFGLPPLEAMACGVPALVSNAASMPEVAGSAALLADPLDTADIRRNLERLLTDDRFRARAAQAGPARAAGFSWRACAEKTIGVYYRVSG